MTDGVALLKRYNDTIVTIWFIGEAGSRTPATWVGQAQHPNLESALREIQDDAGQRAPYEVIVHGGEDERSLSQQELAAAMGSLSPRP